jgi:phosphoglycolate phosphatase-like HAD superfamily hydrolase
MLRDALVLFDIDGTLLHVAEEIAFVRAFHELYGDGVDASWPEQATASDCGYIRVVLSRTLRRPATDAEVDQLAARFVAHLEETVTSGIAPVRPVRGAAEFVAACAAGAPIGIATGCIEPSARLKLRHAQLDHHFPCGGYSLRETRRAEIVARAITAAERYYGRRFAPERVVSIGDGVWDVEVARELGLRFIGINERSRGRERLRQAGAEVVLDDFAAEAKLWEIVARLLDG